MRGGPLAVLIVGILLVLVGIGTMTLDYLGRGDSSGLDLKDLGLLIVGIILVIVGGAWGSRGSSTPAPPSN
jgi:hypothetical protein